jgi:DNA ligase (NAD+)
VERAGDVIPRVLSVIQEKRTGREMRFPVPEKCPVCGSNVVREEPEVAVRCIGLNCAAQVREKIFHFSSRGAMNIEGLGEKNIELLHSRGLITHFVDLYFLKKEDLLGLPRFAEKSAGNLINALERSKTTTLSRFLFALGILHVGEYASKLLAKNFAALEDLFHVNKVRVISIKQMGEKIADSVSVFFNDPKNLHTLDVLKAQGFRISNPEFGGGDKGEKPLSGLTFVITGTLPEPRNKIEGMIEKMGGHPTSAISKSTDYVIVGENPGSKLEKARSLGVKTVSFEEAQKLFDARRKRR